GGEDRGDAWGVHPPGNRAWAGRDEALLGAAGGEGLRWDGSATESGRHVSRGLQSRVPATAKEDRPKIQKSPRLLVQRLQASARTTSPRPAPAAWELGYESYESTTALFLLQIRPPRDGGQPRRHFAACTAPDRGRAGAGDAEILSFGVKCDAKCSSSTRAANGSSSTQNGALG
ncbi:hypothetical protein B0T14DRAFT_597553, partial [Immersiella caudata]